MLGSQDMYKPGLHEKPCVIVANKADVVGAADKLRELRAAVFELRTNHGQLSSIVPPLPGGSLVTAVSALHRRNLDRLVQRLDAALATVLGANAVESSLIDASCSGLPAYADGTE